MKTYHVGIRKDYGNPERVILEARRNIDFLSCELWEYFGKRQVTKKQLHERRFGILAWINGYYNTDFTVISID